MKCNNRPKRVLIYSCTYRYYTVENCPKLEVRRLKNKLITGKDQIVLIY